jgi:spore germination cell wall hydrolase CwlJ-like protein
MEQTVESVANYENNLTGTISNAFRVIGFALIMVLLLQVIDFKFSTLRDANNLLDEDGVAVTADQRIKELACLTKNIYWEAASEPFEGKVAVAQVTINRVNSGQFANSICGVVYQKNIIYEKVICQFSWACENTHKTKAIYPKLWNESEEVAKRVLLEKFRLPGLNEALYYHADYVNPAWNRTKIDKIGHHIFYK